MSQLINKFSCLSDLNDEFKNNIKVLFVYSNWIYDKELSEIILNKYNYLIVTKNDLVYAFGENSCGLLGFGHNGVVVEPTLIVELSNKQIIDFSVGLIHCIARDVWGRVYCFGRNYWGLLGIGSEDNDFHKPVLIEWLSDKIVIDMGCGDWHSVVLTTCGEVYAWGRNQVSQIGNGCHYDQLTPIKLNAFNGEKVEEISCGSGHTLALTGKGRVYSWGLNNWGQLGIGNTNNANIPNAVIVRNFERNEILFSKISCGFRHSLLLSIDGDIYAFGSNNWGQLGDGSQANQKHPKKIDINNKFIDIKTMIGFNKSIALSIDNEFYIWGEFNNNTILSPKKINYKSFNDIIINFENITLKPLTITETDFLSLMRVNQYKIEFSEHTVISSGGFGVVFEALNKKSEKVIAIKKIPLNENEIIKTRRELEIMTKLKSDYIVKYEKSWIEKNYYISDDYKNENKFIKILSANLFHPKNTYLLHIQMELCSKTLEEVIEKLRTELDIENSILHISVYYYVSNELLRETLEGVKYLHKQKIIHRDLNPSNILINEGFNGKFVKIGDFGLSVLHEFDGRSHTRDVGTHRYTAPEIIKSRNRKSGRIVYGLKTDIYSLGCIIQEMFDLDDKVISSEENHIIFCKKFENLMDLKKRMLYEKRDQIELRPNCDQILNLKVDWYLCLSDLKYDFYFRQLLSEETMTVSINENFHKYFIRKKLEVLYNSLSIVEQNLSSDINVFELKEILENFYANRN